MMKINKNSSLPLFEQVKEELIQDIESNKYKAGDFLPCAETLSREYGVSLITIRRAISDLAHRNYITTLRGKRPLVNRRNNPNIPPIPELHGQVGILFYDKNHKNLIENSIMPWTHIIFSGIQELLIKSHCISSLIPVDDSNLERTKQLISNNKNNFEGFILLSPIVGEKLYPVLEQCGKPFVMINQFSRELNTNYVTDNIYEISAEVAEYFVKTGMRSFLHIFSENLFSEILRIRGFQETLLKHNINPLNIDFCKAKDLTVKSGIETFANYLKSKKLHAPLGVLTSSDHLAMGVITHCVSKKINVPHEVSVVGGAGLPESANYTPSLSTINTPMLEMGRTAVRMLFEMIETEVCVIKGKKVTAKFIPRDSVKKLPE